MSNLTTAQALSELRALNNPSLDQLRDIVSRTSVGLIDSSITIKGTILYSGWLQIDYHADGSPLTANQAAKALAEADPAFAIIDNTHVGRLLTSDSEFVAAVRQAAGRAGMPETAAEVMLGSSVGGFWSSASIRFAEAAKDTNIIIIAPKPSAFGEAGINALNNSILKLNELPTLLGGNGTGTINGIQISALKTRYSSIVGTGLSDASTSALNDVTDLISVKSMSDMWTNFEISRGSESGKVTVRADADYLASNAVAGVGEIRTGGFVQSNATAMHKIFAEVGNFNLADMTRLMQSAASLKALKGAGQVLGPVGDLIELAALTGAVVGQLRAGDREGAARTAANGLASIGGGALAAGTAAVWAAPLLAGGPVGWVGYGIVVVGAGIAGSELGQAIADRAYPIFMETLPSYFSRSEVDPIRWIGDGAGLYHSFVTQTLPNGLDYAARFTRELLGGEIDVIKWFAGDTPTPDEPDIIVTANRRTGQTSISNLPSLLLDQPAVAQALASALLDFARSGRSFQPGSGAGDGSSAGWGTPSTLAEARAPSSMSGQQQLTPVLQRNADGTVTIGAMRGRILGTDGRNGLRIEDAANGSLLDFRIEDVGGVPTTRLLFERNYSGGLEVTTEYEADGKTVKNTALRHGGNPEMVTFSDAAGILGDVLGNQLAAGNRLTSVVASATLRTVGQNLGEALDAVVFGSSANVGENIEAALQDFSPELLANLKAAGIGALSSYLTAELIGALGVEGFAGELASTAAGTLIGEIVANIAADIGGEITDPFAGIGSKAILGSAVGSFLGTKLAAQIISFDTIEGQIGASVGSSLGVLALVKGAKIGALLGGGFAGAVLGAAVGAFLGYIGGGLVGSLFAGTARASADVVWDYEAGGFEAANGYARRGGSRSAAEGMAGAVADTLNSVLAQTGGRLVDPGAVQAGTYGMWKKDYVYRPHGTRDEAAITRRFSGKDGAEQLITYGLSTALNDADFKIVGGEIYAKRALYNGIALGNAAGGTDASTILGDLAVADRYSTYLSSSASINALIAAEPDSVFAAEWAITLARSVELGLTRRHASDWYGGFGALLDEAGATAAQASFGFDYDPLSGRVSRLIGMGDFVLGDAIDIAGQTQVAGTAATETIDLRANAYDGKAIDVAATIDAGDGSDRVYASDRGDNVFGGLGNDTLVGGELDDWLLGGDGNDRLLAAAVTPTSFADTDFAAINAALAADGGSGNYLDGGAGDDRIYGSTGSDWLVGGDGLDGLYGGAGGDILDAGRGNEGSVSAPLIQGGGGSDQYVYNRGDGQDVYYDDATGALPGASSDSIGAATRARTANTLAKNWAGGGEFLVDGSTRGGEDAIEFGADITMKDILLQRSGTINAPGMDLIIKIQNADGEWLAGNDQIIVRDWFEGTRKIEWLRFANGEELRIGDFVTFKLGTAGADVIVGTGGNDFLYGGDGNDKMFGLNGNDFAAGGRGNDMVSGNDDNDIVLGGNDDDVVLGGLGKDSVSGDDGDDRVYGGGGDDIVSGGRGDDELVGGSGNDVFRFERGDGRDTLFDEFAGTWELVWQGGSYVNGYTLSPDGLVRKGGTVYNDGTNWIGRYDYNEQGANKTLYRLVPPGSGSSMVVNSGVDTLEFGVGIDIQDVVFRQDGNDLRIAITRSGASIDQFDETVDQIRIVDWYLAAPAGKSIENFQFVNTGAHLASGMNLVGGTDGDDTIAAAAGIAAWVTGGAGDDTVTGTSRADILSGSSGSDTLTGLQLDDVLFGGDGDDVLVGGSGADVLIGGSGSDTASYAGAVAVTVFLDAAQGQNTSDAIGDTFVSIENLTGSGVADTLYGDTGSNVLDGGAGNDVLYGNVGDDIYLLNATSGTDTVVDRVMNGTTVVAGDAGDDTVEVGAGLSLSNLVFVKVDNNLEIRIGVSTLHKLVLTNFYLTPDAKIETLVLSDGLLANLASVRIGAEAASAEADLIVGTASTDTLNGLGGADVISGAAGNDTLLGGDGDDTLEGGAGGDTFDGGMDTISSGGAASAEGNGDLIRYAGSASGVSVNLGTRVLSGGEATGDVIVADGSNVSTVESVGGSAFADTLVGDARANMLIGLAGADTLSGAAGDDVLVGGDDADTISGGDGDDNIDAGDGHDVDVRGNDGNDLIAGGAGDDTLFGDAGTDMVDGGLGNDNLWGGADDDTLGGGDGNDVLNGDAGEDKLSGGAGNDILRGDDGNDTLSGDLGDDALVGGHGDDNYAFDGNSGVDTIVDASGANRILIAGVTQDQVWLTRAGNDLNVGVIGGSTRITVAGYFAATTPTLVREIATSGASIFLKYVGGQAYAGSLIEAMTLASPGVPATIPEIPAAVASARDAVWWQGGKASPRAMDQTLETNEGVALNGTLAVTDHDENVSEYGVATQATHGIVVVNAVTGAWTYTPDAYYSGVDSFSLSVKDADNQSASATISLTISPANDAPRWGALPALAVNENSENGLVIGTLAATDADGDVVVYSILDVNSPFAMSASGVLSVRDRTQLNFEASAIRSVNVRASDGEAHSDQLINVTINDVAEAPNTPTAPGGSVARVSEPAAGAPAIGGTTIATFTRSDPDGPVPTLRLRSGSTTIFSISNNMLKLNAAYSPDFETLAVQPSAVLVDRDGDGLREIEFSAEVESWDGAIASVAATRITVGIEDTNEAPTAINFTSPTVAERDRPIAGAAAPAISLGLLSALDPDLAIAGESFVYSIGNPQFEIVNGNQMRLKAGQALNYESAAVESGTGKRYFDVAVTASDRAGGQGSKSLTLNKRIYISDVTDYHYGTPSADTLTGDVNTDWLYGSDGNDTLSGGGGNDTIYGEVGNDNLSGGDGNDAAYGGVGDDYVSGGLGNDVLWGDDGADELIGGSGIDQLNGGTANDRLFGGDQADTLRGDDGDDYLDGGSDASADTLQGGAGNDQLIGGAGNDALDGGSDHDLINGGGGADTIVGGSGTDTVTYATSALGVSVNLASGVNDSGEAQGDTLSGIENVIGSGNADTLVGDAGSNRIEGGDGGDWLQGEAGDDGLFGQSGNDTQHGMDGNDQLDGGAGSDTLYGGDGNDVLTGGLGDDLLFGGVGDDRYTFQRGDGNDIVDQTGSQITDSDIVGFTNVNRDNLWFRTVGSDIHIGVLGTSGLDSSVTLKSFLSADVDQRAQIRVVIAQTDATIDLKLGELTGKLDRFATALGYTITTQAQFDSLRSNTALRIDGLTFSQTWDNYWTTNAPAVITPATASLTMSEDQYTAAAYGFTFTISDDYDSPSQLLERTVMAVASSGSTTASNALLDVSVAWPGSNGGSGTIAVRTQANASGTGYVWVHTKDTGGLVTDRWIPVSVAAVADVPTVSGSSPGGNAGTGIPITIAPQLSDTDGSESIVIRISAVPLGFTFSNASGSVTLGNNRGGDGVWSFSVADLAGLRLDVPAGWSQNLTGASALQITAIATESSNGSMAVSTPFALPVVINAAPAAPALTNMSVNENVAPGTVVGMLVANDPDRVENNPFDYASSSLYPNESRWLSNTPGPQGGSVSVLQTGQMDAENGGGVHSNMFTIDPSKAYKFTVYVRADTAADTRVYFGVHGSDPANVENATGGWDDPNPYFVYPVQNTLAVGQWYRFEGYVLPQGAPLVEAGVYGGIFNVATGQKIADANVFRWNDAMVSASTTMRFFNYYGSAQGYSTSWYEPVIEQLPTFTHTGGGGVTVDSATGLVRVSASPNYELATSLPLNVTVTDAGGLQSHAALDVAVNDVNEAPSIVSGTGRSVFTETGFGYGPANGDVIVATISVADPDNNSNPTLEFVPGGNPGNWFYIDQASKQVRFSPGHHFDYEAFAAAGYALGDWNNNGIPEVNIANVFVRANDGSLLSNEGEIKVWVEDSPEAPLNLRLDRALSIPENQGAGDLAYMVANDPEGNPLTYSIVDGMDGGGRFSLRSDGLLSSNGTFDYETATSFSIRVRATDPTGMFVTQDFLIPITDINERPNVLRLEAQNFFPETQGAESHAGRLIARFELTDPEGPTPSLVIVGGNENGWFQVVGDHVAFTGSNFSADWLRSTMGSYGQDSGYYFDNNANGLLEVRVARLTLAAQDANGLRSDPFDYQVFIEDANEAPTITTTSFSVPENSPAAGIRVGTLIAQDLDVSPGFGGVTFRMLSGDDTDTFRVNSLGDINLHGLLNYNSRSRYDLLIEAKDAGGLSSSRVVTINVTDTNAAPAPTGTGSVRTGTSSVGLRVGTIYANDPDPGDTATYQIVSVTHFDLFPGGTYSVDSTGAVRSQSAGSGNYQYREQVTVRVTDSRGEWGETTIEITYNSTKPFAPVVIDLDGDGIELVSLSASQTRFDLDYDGLRDRTGWVAADDGFLAVDRDGNGLIDNPDEISFINDLVGARSDLEGLRTFDTDGDGVFGSGDRQYGEFRIWQDLNQDGISQTEELTTLAERGIESITLELDETGEVAEGATDNVLFATSEFTRRNGSTGDVGDVFLAYESAADTDSKGKRKEGKKVKLAGLEKVTDLPDKLKKKKSGGSAMQSGPGTEAQEDQVGPTSGAKGESLVNPAMAQPMMQQPSSFPAAGNTSQPLTSRVQATRPTSGAENIIMSQASTATPSTATSADRGAIEGAEHPASLAQNIRPVADLRAGLAQMAADRLRRPRSISLNTGISNVYAAGERGPQTYGASLPASDGKLERLISAMASFQGGEGVGDLSLASTSQIDTVMAQLAPAA